MRKLLIAGLAVASLTGIAYAQVTQRNAESWAEVFSAKNRPTTCLDHNGAVRNLGETTLVSQVQFQCVQVWGDGLSGLRTGWLRVSQPPATR